MSSLGNDFHVAWHEQEEKLYRLTCNYFWMQRKGSKDRVLRFIESDCSDQRSRIKVEEPGLTTLRNILEDKDSQWQKEDGARHVICMVTKIQARFRGYRARKIVDTTLSPPTPATPLCSVCACGSSHCTRHVLVVVRETECLAKCNKQQHLREMAEKVQELCDVVLDYRKKFAKYQLNKYYPDMVIVSEEHLDSRMPKWSKWRIKRKWVYFHTERYLGYYIRPKTKTVEEVRKLVAPLDEICYRYLSKEDADRFLQNHRKVGDAFWDGFCPDNTSNHIGFV